MNDERAANAIDKKVGQRVRTRRLEIGMSQERLAELLGVTFQQVQKYEKGVNRIAVSRLWQISLALELPVARFFEGLATLGVAESRQEYVDDALATPEGAQLMAVFATIKSAKVRRRVLDLVRTLTEEDSGKR
ncbi:MAG: helix-turn-helix transcriptional regulator [Hyphomonadaceae bacterium]|nr:helix-turn-helix transcriptional regulator [Hyphomonadaceae bacterium]